MLSDLDELLHVGRKVDRAVAADFTPVSALVGTPQPEEPVPQLDPLREALWYIYVV